MHAEAPVPGHHAGAAVREPQAGVGLDLRVAVSAALRDCVGEDGVEVCEVARFVCLGGWRDTAFDHVARALWVRVLVGALERGGQGTESDSGRRASGYGDVRKGRLDLSLYYRIRCRTQVDTGLRRCMGHDSDQAKRPGQTYGRRHSVQDPRVSFADFSKLCEWVVYDLVSTRTAGRVRHSVLPVNRATPNRSSINRAPPSS